MSCEIKTIDGSSLEGGGQILRIALTLSVIKNIPVRIVNIRAGRSKPGLMEQHLKGFELLAKMCNASKVKGAKLGSTTIELWPKELKGGTYDAPVKTAGSVSLLLQAALPCALFASSKVTLRLFGGTNVGMAPQIDFMTEVFRPNLEKFGATFDFQLVTRGYYPKGGGEVTVTVDPITSLNGVNLTDPGEVTSIHGWSFTAGSIPIPMAHTMANSAITVLKTKFKNFIKIDRYKEDRVTAPDDGSGIVLVADTSTGCVFGGSGLKGRDREKPADIAAKAAQEIVDTLEENGCVDRHVQDQLIVFMALADGPSRIRVGEITLHTKTAIFIAEQMTDAKFKIISDGRGNLITCSGNK